jgi:hypothetical protein
MNDRTTDTRGPRRAGARAGALAAMAAVAVLATACGTSSAPSTATVATTGSAAFTQLVALAHCMRSHGAPNFPDPSPSGFHLTMTPNGPKGSIDIDSSQIRTAYGACRHLLPGGGPNLAQLQQQAQQRLQQALPGLLRFSQCMRSHGVPSFPDPTANGLNLGGSGISPASPQFRAALRACQHALPAGVHMHIAQSAEVHQS